jgi:hypothetical protein
VGQAKSAGSPVVEFFRTVGVTVPKNLADAWRSIERQCGSDYAQLLSETLDRRAEGHSRDVLSPRARFDQVFRRWDRGRGCRLGRRGGPDDQERGKKLGRHDPEKKVIGSDYPSRRREGRTSPGVRAGGRAGGRAA